MADLVSTSTGRPCDVVPLGVDHKIFSPGAQAGDEILCVADFYAHKRHDLLLEAWLLLASPKPRLRLLGDPAVDPSTHAGLVSRIETLAEADSITLEYRLPHERMGDAYRRARVFASASEYESFCMPVAEGMACGVPVVVRDLGSLRETGGDGARYVDGNDPVVWAAAMQQLIDDDSEHQRARSAALTAAERFAWEDFAEAIAIRL
jgi:glycosyltransferase involved in cell wall biosynthesis